MSKKFKEIFVDFDDTITDSLSAFCKIYNKRYSENVDWENIRAWDCKDQCKRLKEGELLDIFSSDEFFRTLKTKRFVREVLENLSKDYPVTIVSIGTPDNCSKKSQFIKLNFPFVSKAILISSDKKSDLVMDKSFIDMKQGVFVDDVTKNLISSNAKLKILFETVPNAEWNRGWEKEKMTSWQDFYKYF